MQGICSAFRSTDLSVGTSNYLKREENSDYKQVLPTLMILLTADEVVYQKAERWQLSLPCGVLPHAMTYYNTVGVMLFVVPEKLT